MLVLGTAHTSQPQTSCVRWLNRAKDMYKTQVTVARRRAKDAALFCGYVIPLSLIWEQDPDEPMDLQKVLSQLLPPGFKSDASLMELLTACIDGTQKDRRDLHAVLYEDGPLPWSPNQDVLQSISRLATRVWLATQDTEDRYCFFDGEAVAPDEHSPQFYSVTIQGLDLIDATNISWEKILAIRTDPSVRSRLRRFRLLFEQEYQGKSKAYVEDDILRRIDDYRAVVREYRLETKLLVLEQLLASKTLATVGGTSLVAALIGAPILVGASALVGAVVEVGKICVRVAQRRHKLDKELATLPVGYVVYLQDRFGMPNRT